MTHTAMRPPYSLRALAITTISFAVLALGACSTRQPAPIVNRTTVGGSVAQTPQAAPQVPVAPTPAAVPQASEAQSAPVRSATVDTKPLETKPLDNKSVQTSNSAAGASAMRTQPKGLKRPYSDTLFADLKAADAPPPPAVLASAVAPTAAAEAKPGPLTLAWPSAGKLIQTFGKDKSTGLAFSGKLGDGVMAAADGKVIFSNTTLPQYGKMIIVKHDDDTHTVYAHNKNLLVKEGQQVKKGQKIAELGDSGTTQPKLYFEVRRQGKPVDPQKLLPARL